ncbi:MAG: hypothetical protein CMG46_03960, partial [Candidatus Marinimicrobia bacterium]|nr:hypothetical protein [Candidatus Neomarinimicrobiota bacterium]
DPVDAPWKYSDLNSQSLDFLKYPLSRSPSDGEDSLLIKAIKYEKIIIMTDADVDGIPPVELRVAN